MPGRISSKNKIKSAKDHMLKIEKDWIANPDNIVIRKIYYDAIGDYCKLIADKPHARYGTNMLRLYNQALSVCDDAKEREKIVKFLKVLKVAQKVLG